MTKKQEKLKKILIKYFKNAGYKKVTIDTKKDISIAEILT